MSLEVNEMGRLAKSLWAVAAREEEESQVAIAWLARNLVAGLGLSVDESCARVRSLWSPAAWPGPYGYFTGFADQQFCRSFSILCQVWSGDLEDPTAGATSAHRHDEAPDWAQGISATALIGPWIFYRRI